MTLLEKINKLTWFSEIIKLKDIFKDFLEKINLTETTIETLQTDVEELQNNPIDSKPYKVYTALLTQDGSNAPTVVELENTLGLTFTLNRQNTGTYNILGTNIVLPLNKTTVDIGSIKSTSNITDAKINVTLTQTGTNAIQINTFMALSSTWNRSDFCLYNTKLEIRVYN